jgi:ribosomal protein S18 acetylase RimI-like enzyme
MVEQFNSASLNMTWSDAPWDQVVCGFPVLQITAMEIRGPTATEDFRIFERVRDNFGAGLVSCRLPHQSLPESMLLEEHGFRFIEMVYRPELELSKVAPRNRDEGLVVLPAGDSDMPALLEIAGRAFRNERFRMDPRLDPDASDLRYQNWVASSLRHATQQLYVVHDAARIVAFFVTEALDDGTCYWHLNALAPDAQGQGYGRRVWLCMLDQASKTGAKRVCSSIVARNVRVLGLYARLGFQLAPPTMTFHWVRSRV